MAEKPSPPAPAAAKVALSPAAGRPLLPPEEQFWQRYSPRLEFPLSALGSAIVHVAALVLLLLVASYLLVDNRPIEVEPIALIEGGGGGLTGGLGSNPGVGTTPPEELVNPESKDTEVPPYIGPKLSELPRPKVDPAQFAEFKDDPDSKRLIENGTQALPSLAKLQKEARSRLMEGLLAGQGDSGKGRDGGKDTGRDKGQGPGIGEGTAGSDLRKKRVLRWTMMFDTRDGYDYVRQLAALGAILGVPQPDGSYVILRNLLQKPAQGMVEDLTKINRIFWVDDRADSLRMLAQALGLERVPDHVVAFFPKEFEAELTRKEFQYHRKPEHLIQETRFRVIRRGAGWEAVVIDGR